MAKPIVDGLERELEGQARVVRLNVLSKMGQNTARRYGVMSMPTFLIFDGQGELIGRQVGFPNRNEITALVTSQRGQ
jgi:thiol-disulfide isomerase/thioredoxin